MWNKFKTWHTGLSNGGKILLWAVALVVGAGVVNAAASPSPPSTPEPVVQTPTPTIETKEVTETENIPFSKTTVKDSNLAKGKKEIRIAGKKGVKKLTYEVTYSNGVEIKRKLTNEKVTKEPVKQVTAIGTYVKPKPVQTQPQISSCDSNYSGCVPIASDVDCAGGSGNGPAYVTGPVRVIGSDIYGLDGDGDGYGCD